MAFLVSSIGKAAVLKSEGQWFMPYHEQQAWTVVIVTRHIAKSDTIHTSTTFEMLGPSKDGFFLKFIMHSIIWANQKTELFFVWIAGYVYKVMQCLTLHAFSHFSEWRTSFQAFCLHGNCPLQLTIVMLSSQIIYGHCTVSILPNICKTFNTFLTWLE